jgi:predicted HTH domain antitoxin
MAPLTLNLQDDVIRLLEEGNRPAEEAARELIVLELFRQGVMSRGKAAEILGLSYLDFLRRASSAGIPVIDMTPEEWEQEMETIRRLG